MYKTKLLLLFVVMILAKGEQGCPENYIRVQGECIRSCQDPFFDDCSDTFITLYDPHCGYSSDGKWTKYSL